MAGYLQRRGAKNGTRFPRVIAAELILRFAERFRSAGNMDRCRSTIALALENHPGHTMLKGLEQQLQPETPIRWRDLPLPRPERAELRAA